MGIPSAIINDHGAAGLATLAERVAQGYERAIIGSRVSSKGQKINGSLDAQTKRNLDAVRAYPQLRLRGLVYGVEKGQLSGKRDLLKREIALAKRHGAILVKWDLSRFVRSELYHRQNNNLVEPSPEEIEQLLEMADGVPLATVVDPWLSESDRHSIATQNGNRPPGRKPRLSYDEISWAIDELRRGVSQRAIAESLGMKSSSSLRRALKRNYPEEPSIRWVDLVDAVE